MFSNAKVDEDETELPLAPQLKLSEVLQAAIPSDQINRKCPAPLPAWPSHFAQMSRKFPPSVRVWPSFFEQKRRQFSPLVPA